MTGSEVRSKQVSGLLFVFQWHDIHFNGMIQDAALR